MLSMAQLQTMHEQALADCADLIGRVDDLGRPTPCEGWQLSALLGHMIGQNDGFALAVRDGDAAVAAFHPVAVDLATAAAIWARSADRLRAAFESAQEDAVVRLAEFDSRVSVRTALRMQLLDTAVHAWDVAASLRMPYRPSDDTAVFVRDYARTFVKPAGTPGVFAAPIEQTGHDAWEDGLRLLGRDPEWAAPG